MDSSLPCVDLPNNWPISELTARSGKDEVDTKDGAKKIQNHLAKTMPNSSALNPSQVKGTRDKSEAMVSPYVVIDCHFMLNARISCCLVGKTVYNEL